MFKTATSRAHCGAIAMQLNPDSGSGTPSGGNGAIRPSQVIKTAMTKPRSHSYFSILDGILHTFSPGERLLLYIVSIILSASALALLIGVNAAVSVVIPSSGGTLTEGVVSPPRFINPILDVSQADGDLTTLVYSGLTRSLADGSVVPDLAEKFDISPDGTIYTFILRKDAVFHDGTRVTANDVLFTVQSAQNPEIKSPRRADWDGVAVSSPDELTVIFKLQHAYAPFLENTTLGILPKHLWGSVSAEEFPFSLLNKQPVGSGPYKVDSFQTDGSGIATSYTLSPFKRFALGRPYLNKIRFLFYPNVEALIKAYNSGSIDSMASISPSSLPSVKRAEGAIMRVPLPRVFGVFFNQGHSPVLADAAVRYALDASLDKQEIVNSVLLGYGTVLNGPIPPGVIGSGLAGPAANLTASSSVNIAKARDILSRGGWTYDKKTSAWKKKKQVLSFALATSDSAELVATANKIAGSWRELGVSVGVKVYPLSELNSNIIRPRAYDALLFGEVVGRTLDLFAFWHSSQRNDPGLNLAMYANSKVDSVLASARATTDRKAREASYSAFVSAVAKDDPAIFLYSPEFIYIVPSNIRRIKLGALTTPGERFLNVHEWYTETENVWNFFTNEHE